MRLKYKIDIPQYICNNRLFIVFAILCFIGVSLGLIFFAKDRILTGYTVETKQKKARGEVFSIGSILSALMSDGLLSSGVNDEVPFTSLPDPIISALREWRKQPTDNSSDDDILSKAFGIPKSRIHRRVVLDPWNRPYHILLSTYSNKGGELYKESERIHIKIWSSGKNGIDEYGEGDDIVYWK